MKTDSTRPRARTRRSPKRSHKAKLHEARLVIAALSLAPLEELLRAALQVGFTTCRQIDAAVRDGDLVPIPGKIDEGKAPYLDNILQLVQEAL